MGIMANDDSNATKETVISCYTSTTSETRSNESRAMGKHENRVRIL